MSSSVSVEQQSPFNLANRCAVVTGGSTGIGRASRSLWPGRGRTSA